MQDKKKQAVVGATLGTFLNTDPSVLGSHISNKITIRERKGSQAKEKGHSGRSHKL
jgi:hypothetical protein